MRGVLGLHRHDLAFDKLEVLVFVEDPGLLHAQDLVHLRVGFDPGTMAVPTLFKPVGCTSCSNTGYRGRIAVHEVMTVSEEIERMAVARSSSAEIMRVARSQGMITLREDGWAKALLGDTSIEEILRVVA